MIELTLDGREIETVEQLHDLLARELSFPAYYGRNLDALFDCLTSCQADAALTLLYPEALTRRLGCHGRALPILLRRAAQENPHFTFSCVPEEEA